MAPRRGGLQLAHPRIFIAVLVRRNVGWFDDLRAKMNESSSPTFATSGCPDAVLGLPEACQTRVSLQSKVAEIIDEIIGDTTTTIAT